MNITTLKKMNKATLDRLWKKNAVLLQTNPLPYINSQVLIEGMINAIEIMERENTLLLTPDQVEIFTLAYTEAMEGILDTVNERQSPVVCVYIREDELWRLVESERQREMTDENAEHNEIKDTRPETVNQRRRERGEPMSMDKGFALITGHIEDVETKSYLAPTIASSMKNLVAEDMEEINAYLRTRFQMEDEEMDTSKKTESEMNSDWEDAMVKHFQWVKKMADDPDPSSSTPKKTVIRVKPLHL